MPRWLLLLLAAALTFTAGFLSGCWWGNWYEYRSIVNAAKGRVDG